jgi:acyl-coenzyme A synthetase/AMP-(fatty) acid ligase
VEVKQLPQTAGRKVMKEKHSASVQAAAMHSNMLMRQARGDKSSPSVSSPTGEEWSKEQWEKVRKRVEEAGEVAMTLVYKDGSSQLRSMQVMNIRYIGGSAPPPPPPPPVPLYLN